MAQCVICNSYYRKSKWNSSDNCESCLYTVDDFHALDEEDEMDLKTLLNPTGKTQAAPRAE